MARRLRNRRRPARRPRRRVRRNPEGGFKLTRRVPCAYLCNSGVTGIPSWTGPAALLNTGTPVAHPVYPNIYTVPFSMAFSLDMLSQYTELINIADRYKINSVSVKVLYSANSIMGGPSGGSGFSSIQPTISWLPDYDDATPPTTTLLDAKMGLKTKALGNGKFVSIRVRPKVAQPVYDGLITTAYTVPTKQLWVNSVATGVPHYGIKGYISNWDMLANTNVTSAFTFDVTFNVSLKDLQ